MNEPITNISILVYRYNDASVPPEYHRSYTISVTPETVHLSVDSYGTILLEKSFPLKQSAYQSFVTDLLPLKITNHETADFRPVPGGTSDFLHIYLGDGIAVKGQIYHGAGKSFGTLAGNVAEAVRLFKALVPDLKKKVAGEGRKGSWF